MEENKIYNFIENFTKEEVERIINIIPEDFLKQIITQAPKAFKNETHGFRATIFSKKKLVEIFLKKVLIKKDGIITSLLSNIINKDIKRINDKVKGMKKIKEKLLKDKKFTKTFLETTTKTFFKKDLELYFKLQEVEIEDETLKELKKELEITQSTLKIRDKLEKKIEESYKAKEGFIKKEIKDLKFQLKEKEKINKTKEKELIYNLNKKENLISDLTNINDDLKNSLKRKDKIITECKNIIKDKSKELTKLIEEQWEKENQKKINEMTGTIQELTKNKKSKIQELETIKKDKLELERETKQLEVKNIKLKKDTLILEEKQGEFLDKFEKVFGSRSTKMKLENSLNYYIYEKETSGTSQLEIIEDKEEFIEELIENLEIVGIDSNYIYELSGGCPEKSANRKKIPMIILIR